jgi:hypothetical protein
MTTQAEENEIRPFAPPWLPQPQRRYLDRILNKLVEREACSICGSDWKLNSHTAYGLDAQNRVVVAGTCCIGKIATILGYGFFGRETDLDEYAVNCPSSTREHSVRKFVHEHSAREWKTGDRVWFNEHPARSHRARMPFTGEDCLFDTKALPGCAPIVLVRQTRPGTWLQCGFYLNTNLIPVPDDEALIHAIGANRRRPPCRRSALCATKYATTACGAC